MTEPDPMSGSRDFLAGAGKMARLMRAYDWTTTPLGEPEGWPAGLRTAVRLLLNSHHPMHIFWGAEATFFYNDAFVPSAGPERHPSVLGRPASETWGEIWPVIGSEVAKVRNGGGHTWYEDRHVPIMRHGRLEDAYWTYGFSPIDDDTAPGGIGGVVSILTETTKRKALEDSLRASNQRHRDLLRQMPGFVAVLTGPTHVYEYVNEAYVTIAGQRSFLGHGVREVFPDLVGQGFFELLDGVYATGEPFVARSIPIRLGGEDDNRFIDLLYHPIRNDDGAVTGIFVGGYDVTVQNRATVALRELNETLEQRVAERSAVLVETEERLRQSQKMEAVGQLTGGLAHDFNNLLAGISGSLEMMQNRMRQGRFQDVERYMAVAQEASKRAASLTHRLLAFSRRQTLDPKPTDVNRLVEGMQEMIQRTVGPSISVEVVGASGLWAALVDAPQLENALLNLCINARDAMPDGGRITVETHNKWIDERAARKLDIPEGQYLSLCVTDTGTGMSPDVIARVFEPFFTTKPMGEGTGLGLSMTYGFAQQSGGQVRIYSEVGEGSTVCIYLPRHYGEVEDEEGAAKLITLDRSDQGETVLVVDDEPSVRMLITDILEDLGYLAIEANDSAAGLKVLQSDVRIDLLVTDVGLPGGMNGRQMADAAQVSRPDLKVLFITGYAENAILSNGTLPPGMWVLTKPFAMDAMATRIRSLIEVDLEAKR
jgi:signal transduction histidine kinase/ActR/RegA family two-component response regulator